MVRKTPIRHVVKSYVREGQPVRAYNRGKGTKEYPTINPINERAPWYYEPDDNSLNSELQELGSGITVDVGGRYGYKALDVFKDGRMDDTLIARLTKKEAENAIDVIYRYIHEMHRFPSEKVELIPGGRYGYTAIDLYRDGKLRATLVAGLTKRKANDFIYIAQRVQGMFEREKGAS